MVLDQTAIETAIVVGGTLISVGSYRQTIKNSREALDEFKGEMHDSIKDIKKALFGNGQPGFAQHQENIIRRLERIEAKCEAQHRDPGDRRRFFVDPGDETLLGGKDRRHNRRIGDCAT